MKQKYLWKERVKCLDAWKPRRSVCIKHAIILQTKYPVLRPVYPGAFGLLPLPQSCCRVAPHILPLICTFPLICCSPLAEPLPEGLRLDLGQWLWVLRQSLQVAAPAPLRGGTLHPAQQQPNGKWEKAISLGRSSSALTAKSYELMSVETGISWNSPDK